MCPSKGRVRQCAQKREPGTEAAVVPDGHQALRRQLLPRGGKNTNPKRLELFSAALGFGARDGFKASAITKMQLRFSQYCFTAHKAASDSVYDNTDWCDAKSFES